MLPGEKSEEVKMKIEKGDFSFNIATAQSGPLSSKMHKAGLKFWLGKGVLTDQPKLFAEYKLQKMVCVTVQVRKALQRRER